METKNWRICRICLKELKNAKNCKNINNIDDEDNIQIITKITYCSQIELKNPIKNLPLRICLKCYEKLILTYKFCMICQDSERKYQEIEGLNNISKNCKKYKNYNEILNKKLITEKNTVNDNIYKNIKFETVTLKEEPSDSHSQDLVSLSDDIELNNETIASTTNSNGPDDSSNDIKNIELISNCNYSPNTTQDLELESVPVQKKKYFKKPKVLEYRCEVCKELFNTRGQMTLHMKTSHTQAYKCKDCSKAFDSNIARNKHERRAHMDPAVRPHKCDFCVRTFYRLDLLKKHKRVHTGEKPFVCEKCGTAFKQIHHLTNHSKSMTPCVLKMRIKI